MVAQRNSRGALKPIVERTKTDASSAGAASSA
jgi:hypothetical protein